MALWKDCCVYLHWKKKSYSNLAFWFNIEAAVMSLYTVLDREGHSPRIKVGTKAKMAFCSRCCWISHWYFSLVVVGIPQTMRMSGRVGKRKKGGHWDLKEVVWGNVESIFSLKYLTQTEVVWVKLRLTLIILPNFTAQSYSFKYIKHHLTRSYP